MNNFVNQSPYLRTSREFPEDVHQLTVEINKMYVDIANAVNQRTISLFPSIRPAITGNSFFLSKNARQQSIRQVYTFNSFSQLAHGVVFSQIGYIVSMYGQYYDGTNWNGLIAATSDVTTIAGQVTFYVDPTYIQFQADTAAPTIKNPGGIIVLEWLSLP